MQPNDVTDRARKPTGMPITNASQAAWGGSRAGNGAAMRCAPIAIRWRDDPVALVRNSILSSVPTHWDERCGWSCALLNLAAASALRGTSITADALLESGLDGVQASLPELRPYGYDEHVPDSIRRAVRKASEAEIADVRFGRKHDGLHAAGSASRFDRVLARGELRTHLEPHRRSRRGHGHERGGRRRTPWRTVGPLFSRVFVAKSRRRRQSYGAFPAPGA